ncbi:hypothetical protein [Hyalangium rubrum]|uniref:Uncharacterized protein n=1 Tax=Hyalangium rubrum TaxID=3103134 RepID=A0ABU5HDR8_9BACT|nr:hypothetical protein [Hyalangium sp. s54d21]MDY7231249.1 hypothetical protein [Hyalangium sp. s54d21]
MNFLRITLLSVVLAAGVASAQGKNAQTPKKPPEPVLTEADMPKTCDDQCTLMDKFCADPCLKGAGANKAAQKACHDNCTKMIDACRGSCREKGRLDKQYMMEKLKPAPGMRPPPGAEEEGDEH